MDRTAVVLRSSPTHLQRTPMHTLNPVWARRAPATIAQRRGITGEDSSDRGHTVSPHVIRRVDYLLSQAFRTHRTPGHATSANAAGYTGGDGLEPDGLARHSHRTAVRRVLRGAACGLLALAAGAAFVGAILWADECDASRREAAWRQERALDRAHTQSLERGLPLGAQAH